MKHQIIAERKILALDPYPALWGSVRGPQRIALALPLGQQETREQNRARRETPAVPECCPPGEEKTSRCAFSNWWMLLRAMLDLINLTLLPVAKHCGMMAPRLLTPLIAVSALVSAATVFGQQRDSVEVPRKIDYPKPYVASTIVHAISNDGRIVGVFFDGAYRPWGFHIGGSGHPSRPVVYPSSTETVLTGVTTAGIACGYYSNSHGFFYDQHTFTPYDYPGAMFTQIRGENDGGDFVGTYQTAPGQPLVGFIKVGGNVTSFSVDDALFTIATGVNNKGEVVGYYAESTEFITHGFHRSVDGTLTFPVDYPNARRTTLYGINDSGTVIGTWEDLDGLSGSNHGLILQLPDLFTSFDLPGATDTYGRGINNQGEIVGSYIDTSGDGHGFVARLSP